MVLKNYCFSTINKKTWLGALLCGALLWGGSAQAAGTLQDLDNASCQLAGQLKADIAACKADPECMKNQEIGAYNRDGGNTSKFYKMCKFRVKEMISACAKGDTRAARQIAINARHAVENWIGQSIYYCKEGQMSCAHIADRFGPQWVTAGDLTSGSPTSAKTRVWNIAKNLPQQSTVDPTAVAILAELYDRLDNSNVCDP